MGKAGSKSRSPTEIIGGGCSFRFEAAKVESLFDILDAVAWLERPDVTQVAQYAGVDPRTAGKLLKNACIIKVVETDAEERYFMKLSYPYKQDIEKKKAVVREALVRMPLLANIRQFLGLGEQFSDAVRKGATVAGVERFEERAIGPLLDWARQLHALEPRLVVEDLVDAASEKKEERHNKESAKRIVFLSHSSKDKALIRQLAADLSAEGIDVWLDEQRIRVGDSIPQRLDQGLAESDFFVIAISRHSIDSEWVKKELNSALMNELSRRKTAILPLKLDDVEMPTILVDRKYANFTQSYKIGLQELLDSIRARLQEET